MQTAESARAQQPLVEIDVRNEPTLVLVDARSGTSGDVAPNLYLRLKYATDRVLAGGLLVLTMPLFAVIALGVRLTLGRGVIFRQERAGLGGSVFTIYKFRTMKPDRRARNETVPHDRRRTHKTTADPRHTRLGRFLRRASLDELPQLINVVNGDMSLVGPRPEIATVVDEHDLWDHPRHQLKPGITGMWQVSELRHELLHENLHIDAEYVEKVSFMTDMRILAQTVSALFASRGS